jgi:hypothetical protein
MWTYHFAALRRALRHSSSKLCILDRNWPCEEIYGHVYRGGTSFAHEGRLMQKVLLKHAALTIVCTTNIGHNLAQIKRHRQQYHSPKFLVNSTAIAERYAMLWHGAPVAERKTYIDDLASLGGGQIRHDWLKYDVQRDGQDVAAFVSKVEAKMAQLRAAQYQPALDFSQRNIAGYLPTAKYLLVGDQVNHNDFKRCWPFTAYSNSSLFMAQAMARLNLREEQFMWTNVDCAESHWKRLMTASPGKLLPVALGIKAQQILHTEGLFPNRMSHPAYGRRFMGLDDWSASLADALQL